MIKSFIHEKDGDVTPGIKVLCVFCLSKIIQ